MTKPANLTWSDFWEKKTRTNLSQIDEKEENRSEIQTPKGKEKQNKKRQSQPKGIFTSSNKGISVAQLTTFF